MTNLQNLFHNNEIIDCKRAKTVSNDIFIKWKNYFDKTNQTLDKIKIILINVENAYTHKTVSKYLQNDPQAIVKLDKTQQIIQSFLSADLNLN